MDASYAPLSEACAKALSDKTYVKRKAAALEVEKYSMNFIFWIVSAPTAHTNHKLNYFCIAHDAGGAFLPSHVE